MMYFINLIVLFAYSVGNMIGSILTGQLPKVSPYHTLNGLVDIISRDYWFDKDAPYQHRSNNTTLQELNKTKLLSDINNILSDDSLKIKDYDKMRITHTIHALVKKYNREIL